MSYVMLAMEILVAVFAVLGFYGTVRWLAQKLFGSKRLAVTIEILTQRDAESAEVLIRDALSQYFLYPSGRIILLTTESLAAHPVLQRVRKQYGLSCYIIGGEAKEQD